MVKHITFAEFLDLYEQGYITEVIVVKSKIYGRDISYFERAETGKTSEIVWSDIP